MYLVYKNKDGKWAVKEEGKKRACKVCSSKAEAVAYATKRAADENTIFKIKDEESKSKGHKTIWIFLFILLLIVIAVLGYLVASGKIKLSFLQEEKPPVQTPDDGDDEPATGTNMNVKYDDFQIHFLELGNEYTGDSTYIKAGNVDILIDAGSRVGSASTIIEYVNQYCTDGKLEYVIATHGDQDHISGMYGTKSGGNYNGILYEYKIGTIIYNTLTNKTTATYSNFLTAVEYAESNGATVLSAADCFNNASGGSRTFVLDEEKDITMDILYNYFYFNEASDENDYSVCTMFNYGDDYHFMMTGDLEEEGEERMAAYYDGSTAEKTLPQVDLFKAGHHGSKTSSNECLLSIIKPRIVTVCCCAGGSEYTANYNNVFPTQDFITRVAKYTELVFVTTYFDEKELKFKPLNGNIVISCSGTAIGIFATNNTTKLKDSTWFNETVYVDSNNNICSGKGKKDFFTENTDGVSAVPRRIWPS